eukprot:TRINITY_DN3481_c2_g1_i1.p1 TRINITY_DN3481_c2_g1~~TRINITY_DN3481_c2_g1_i1.p1  ORF type:complete len:174 (+),score=31.00 TRINITY_DN3481_c2_g1_i1:260-781(+)
MSQTDRVLRSLSVSGFTLLEFVSLFGLFMWKGITGQGQGLVTKSTLHMFFMSCSYVVSDVIGAFCSANPWISWGVSFGVRLLCHPQPYHQEFMQLCASLTSYDDPKCENFLLEELDAMDFESLVKLHSKDISLPPSTASAEALRNILQMQQQQQQLRSEQPAVEVKPHFADLD